ncbi:MAG: T9SS type A sorting domain-containing protein [Chitinophagaceae bacterium]|nr:T9SS type A sorting domain-containing protein [Chitinophagaceae bacterium]
MRKKQTQIPVNIMPNPASNYVNVNMYVENSMMATITLIDKLGSKVLTQKEKLTTGNNNITVNLDKLSDGVYAIIVETDSKEDQTTDHNQVKEKK